jgi:hypothetical protein
MSSSAVPVLAAAAKELFLRRKDPTYPQIVRKAFEDTPIMPPLSGIMTPSRASAMIKALEESGLVIVPVTEEYYHEYKGKPPVTQGTDAEKEEALRKCLPVGRMPTKNKGGGIRGRKAHGIRLVTRDDPIGIILWSVWKEGGAVRGAKLAERSFDSIQKAILSEGVEAELGRDAQEPVFNLGRKVLLAISNPEIEENAA